MSNYINEYSKLKHNPDRIEAFRASGENGIRIFSVLNSNIKALKTVGEYIDTMYSLTTYSTTYKQKNRRVKEFNFRSLDNHTDPRAIKRSDIVIAAGAEFGGYDSAFVTLLLYILLLDTGYEESIVVNRTSKFINELPIFIKRKLFTYARQIVASDALLKDNIYQEIVVLYGDRVLYKEFLEYVSENYPDEHIITELFVREAADPNSPITKRLDNFQCSALKKDALYAIIFYSLDQYVRKCKMKGLKMGKKLINAKYFLERYLDYFNEIFEGSLSWLGKVHVGENMESLKQFIFVTLNDNQRNEIYTCIQNAFNLQIPEKE